MQTKDSKMTIIIAGLIIGVIASVLVVFGNPANMGFCIACFIRDTAGALGLHQAPVVQYIRPEIIGIIVGAFPVSFGTKEFKARGGSSPITRFVLGFCVMIGCLMFLGCPFRMILRMAGGDINALLGLVGFVLGIAVGTYFLKKGFSLKRTYAQPKAEGMVVSVAAVVLLILLVARPAFIFFSEEGPGSKHAAIIISLAAGLIVGILAQRTRLCMAGGVRDLILFKDARLISGFIAIFVGCLVMNLILTGATDGTFFKLAMVEQPVAHTDALWNLLGMFTVGFGAILLGGCPLRQLVMAGEGSSDSVAAVLGLLVGAAFCHNFKLASSGEGPTPNGKIAVILAIVVILIIACVNTFKKKEA
ncbi:MAG: YedE-related selenium metabolism membrane protein [Lachnospiraceae bacterium]|nr:YedE-related selenium metabolism membrane protein [Candidatus Equihabitans merdae]